MSLVKGDKPGHDFRGNQYTGGKPSGSKKERKPRRRARRDWTGEDEVWLDRMLTYVLEGKWSTTCDRGAEHPLDAKMTKAEAGKYATDLLARYGKKVAKEAKGDDYPDGTDVILLQSPSWFQPPYPSEAAGWCAPAKIEETMSDGSKRQRYDGTAFIALNTRMVTRQVVLHEVAHALADIETPENMTENGHRVVWLHKYADIARDEGYTEYADLLESFAHGALKQVTGD